MSNHPAIPRGAVEKYRAGYPVTLDEFDTFEKVSQLGRVFWEDGGKQDDWDFNEWLDSMNAYYFDGEEFKREI